MVRSVLAALVFLAVLSATGNPVGGSLFIAIVMFVFLLGFGWLFDTWFYKWRLRRWEAKRAGTR